MRGAPTAGLLGALALATGAAAAPSRPLDVPLDVAVPKAPTAFRADGKAHLVYELHVTNFSPQSLTLVRVEALDAETRTSLVRYEGTALAGALSRPGLPSVVGLDKLKLGPGLRAVVFVWASVEGSAPPPAALEHEIAVKLGDGTELVSRVPRLVVARDVPTVGPPLRGEWIALNGPSNDSIHRRAILLVGGRAAIAQRFAIDWVRRGRDGRIFEGDPRSNASHHAYGAEALAVADGAVAATKDGIPENVPGLDSRAVPITLETLCGNFVTIDIGGGRFATYCHLQPGSLRAKLGEHVRRGQALGLVGNSGNSTEPHLHFQLSDGPSMASEGLPYAFDRFEVRSPSGTATPRRNELPTQNEAVIFP
ncbi:MAG TPA: M23 family metallopeptidase [Polyangia bacterium]|nr:M23 family metallopeptidase [Polyangia bacterium]